jgi:hypothetical protein
MSDTDKPDVKSDDNVKPDDTSDVKPDVKTDDVKPDDTSDVKPDKPDDSKPEVKPDDSKPEVKPDTVQDTWQSQPTQLIQSKVSQSDQDSLQTAIQPVVELSLGTSLEPAVKAEIDAALKPTVHTIISPIVQKEIQREIELNKNKYNKNLNSYNIATGIMNFAKNPTFQFPEIPEFLSKISPFVALSQMVPDFKKILKSYGESFKKTPEKTSETSEAPTETSETSAETPETSAETPEASAETPEAPTETPTETPTSGGGKSISFTSQECNFFV